jgi:hypothetical protein
MTFTCQSCHTEIKGGLPTPTNDSLYIISCQRCSKSQTEQPLSFPEVKILRGGALTIEYVASGRQDKLKISPVQEPPAAALFGTEGDPPKQVTIEISHAEWLDSRELVMNQTIYQVFCTEERMGQKPRAYHVEALMQDGLVYPLMKNIAELMVARHIETQIESFLKITDEAVPNEAKQ